MKMVPVTSSNLKAVGYDADRRELGIEFRSGDTHYWSNVPAEEHSALMAAKSHGKHFHARIKDNPDYARMKIGGAPSSAAPEATPEAPALDAAVARFNGPAERP